MCPAPTLKSIEASLDEIEESAEASNYAGGGEVLVRKLAPSLRGWGSRDQFFDQILQELRNVTGRHSEILELQSRANKTEHILNLIIDDHTTPAEVRDASIRYVVEHKQLSTWPLVQDALLHQAAHGPNEDVRRLAWFHVCRQRAQGMQRPNAPRRWLRRLSPMPKSVEQSSKEQCEKLRNLRESLIRNRSSLGPRGTVLDPADAYEGKRDLIPELLTALTSSTENLRNEVALALGEIGGGEVGTLLADALRSELRAVSPDEDFQVSLLSALSNIGGADAVDAVLQGAEVGSDRVRQTALAGLEWLATAGAVALTEYPEPAPIDSDELRDAYVRIAERLRAIAVSSSTSKYIRHKANELLDTILISLRAAEVPS